MTLQTRYPVRPEGAFVEHERVRIYYEVHGSGPPVLLHHGFGRTGDHWCDCGYIDALKDEFLVITMDARGHGRSDKPHDEARYTLELRTGDVVAVLDAVGVERVQYWGYSMGARTGFAFVQMHPDRAATFVNGASGAASPKQYEQESLNERARMLRESPGEYVGAENNPDYFLNDFDALAAAALGLLSWDGVDPATLSTPSLHYAGDQDRLARGAQRAAERMPGARFVSLPGLTHLTAFEQSERALPIVLPFLREHARRGTSMSGDGGGRQSGDGAAVTGHGRAGALRTRRRVLRAAALAAAAGGLATLGGGSDAGSEEERVSDGRFDFAPVSQRLRRAVDGGEVEGVGLLITRDGATLYREAFGAYTVETSDIIWSATKLASATAMMSVIDDGLARLDHPISRYLPAFTGVTGAITIRQLLSQTHGLPAGHPTIANPLRDNGLTLTESVDQIARDLTPEYPPGARHRYAPAASYAIFGRIAEAVTGQAWADLFRERVGEPLGMTRFTYGDTRNPRIGGGAAASLDDYGNLLAMHLADGLFQGRRVLSEESAREMRRDQLQGIPFAPVPNKPAQGYGLTWWFDEVTADGSIAQLSVAGGLGAIPWINLPRRYGAFLLLRKDLRSGVAIYDDVLLLIHRALDG